VLQDVAGDTMLIQGDAAAIPLPEDTTTWHPDMPEEYKNAIVTGDARELTRRIPDESIDLILCDPVFSHIEDYEWAARVGKRILKPGGNLITECGAHHMARIIPLMNKHLDWVWLITERFSGGTAQMWSKRIMVFVSPFLWYSKGPRKGGWLIDTQVGRKDKSKHVWGDGPKIMFDIVSRITNPNEIVFDPYTGSGVVPAVCKMLDRNYIAFEVDPLVAEKARERVRNTQPPLFVLQPEQPKFWGDD